MGAAAREGKRLPHPLDSKLEVSSARLRGVVIRVMARSNSECGPVRRTQTIKKCKLENLTIEAKVSSLLEKVTKVHNSNIQRYILKRLAILERISEMSS